MREQFDSRDDDIEYDAPMFIFPDDEEEEPQHDEPAAGRPGDGSSAASSVSVSSASSDSGNQPWRFTSEDLTAGSEESKEPESAPLRYSSDSSYSTAPESVSSGGGMSFTFSKVSEDKPEEDDFVFMPFLDIPDELPEDKQEEQVGFSFSKVKAVKKEKEFVFMPFLEDPQQQDEEAENAEQTHERYRRSNNGTITDEGLVLIPIAGEDEEADRKQEELEREKAETENAERQSEIEDGIYYVEDDGSGHVPTVSETRTPRSSESEQKKPKKKPPQKKKPAQPEKKLTPDEQFRMAMKNIDPALREAVRRDPIQRAALEQAVRIAIVQQAAQEAVFKMGGPSYGAGMPVQGVSIPGVNAPASRGYQQGGKPSSGRGGKPQSGRPSHAGVSRQAAPAARANDPSRDFFDASSDDDMPVVLPPEPVEAAPAPPQTAFSTSPAMSQPAQGLPNPNQDYGVAAMYAMRGGQNTPDAAQDPALTALNSNAAPETVKTPPRPEAPSKPGTPSPASRYNSPAGFSSPSAVRAAMRNGKTITPAQTSNMEGGAAVRARSSDSDITKRSGCLVWIIVLFIAFFFGLIAIAVWPSLSKETKYNKASTAFGEGNYAESVQLYKSLGDYKDSAARASEAGYAIAESYIMINDYENALSSFMDVDPAYSDVSERIAECRYHIGMELLQNGEYAEAYDQLYLIPKYNDAGERAMEANYLCAQALYYDKEYEKAAVRFEMFPEYSDSTERWKECRYLFAEDVEKKMRYTEAYQAYYDAADYKYGYYHAAIVQYKDIIGNGGSYTIDQMRSAVQEVGKYPDDEWAAQIFGSHIYDSILLEKMWVLEDRYFVFKNSDTGNNLSVSIGADGLKEYLNVVFKDGSIYLREEDETPFMRIVSFAPAVSSDPESVTIYYMNDPVPYTFTKS